MFVFVVPIIIAVLFLFSDAVQARTYGSKLCEKSQFNCYVVKRGDTWDKLFPDSSQKDLVMRINRINIHLYPGLRIAVPKDLNAGMLEFAPFSRQISPPGEKIIIVSLNKLAFGAYDAQGTLQYWGPVSGGKGYCPDIGRGCHTASGRFAIYSKGGSGCKSTKFPVGRGGAPMPYCMFFHGGFALHGSYDVPGYNASHGCVRMFVNDARWLNQEFTAGERGTPVLINQ